MIVEPPTRPVPPSTRTRLLPPSLPRGGGAVSASSTAAAVHTCDGLRRLCSRDRWEQAVAHRCRGKLWSHRALHRLSWSVDWERSAIRSFLLRLLGTAARNSDPRLVGGLELPVVRHGLASEQCGARDVFIVACACYGSIIMLRSDVGACLENAITEKLPSLDHCRTRINLSINEVK